MFDIVRLVEIALGTSLTNEQSARLRNVEAERYGGERFYHPKRAARPVKSLIIEAGTTAPAYDVAQRLGVSVRYVRKIRQLAG